MNNEWLWIGFLCVNPAEGFKRASEKGIIPEKFKSAVLRKVFQEIKDSYIKSGMVDIVDLYHKLRRKKIPFTASDIVSAMDAYGRIEWERLKDRMSFGSPYCNWPRK